MGLPGYDRLGGPASAPAGINGQPLMLNGLWKEAAFQRLFSALIPLRVGSRSPPNASLTSSHWLFRNDSEAHSPPWAQHDRWVFCSAQFASMMLSLWPSTDRNSN